MKAFNDRKGAQAAVNTVASETFRTQLPSYLTSATPPDLFTWYPGALLKGYEEKGLLLDISDVWQTMGDYPQSFKTLSGKVFVPTTYYWWGFFYRKSNFAKWGVTPPKTWTEFVDLCRVLQGKGVIPLGMGAGSDSPWTASSWFDYFNIRVNGAPFHRELLAGKQKFDDPRVKAIFTPWREVLPFTDPNGTAIGFQEATTAMLQGRTGMLLTGAFFADAAPKDAIDDIDFFRFPIIDPKVPLAEEGPTDGFFASAKSPHVKELKEFLTYAATAEGQEAYIKASSGTVLPTHPNAEDSGTPLVTKGRQHLKEAAEITQFFNRDSSDALQPTADAALIKFLQQPDQLDTILADWQKAAQQVWSS
ncbi:ABC transporter substrate-binding protein [Lentzea cavernae]|uniref:ABC transporter substrate-binding protein n=1 Tax=Lentzea cavernae TaxID=2020703 RepID=A0ABQ3M621_9PSEU|nr:ABC transporter substrate-binding protein [Lentzea cavernae]